MKKDTQKIVLAALGLFGLGALLIGGKRNPLGPIAGFNVGSVSGTSPLVLQFDDTSEGGPTAWEWDFGDGSFSSSQNPQHTYDTPGTYNVVLTVENEYDTDTATVEIVVGAPIQAYFTASPLIGYAPLEVHTSGGSTGDIVAGEYDFGDGSPPVAQINPSHIYSTPGIYTITLTIQGPSGVTDSFSVDVEVTDPPIPPVANFGVSIISSG